MTIAQAQEAIRHFGTDASFVANVIATQHKNRARKLLGLLGLLKDEHSVRIQSFDIDVLLVDGKPTAWGFLETSVARFPWNHPEAFERNA